MTFLALHRGRVASLAGDALWLSADDATRCADAVALLQRLEALALEREAELAAARRAAEAEGAEAGRREALAQEAAHLWDAWDQAARSADRDVQALREALVSLSLQVVRHVAGALAQEQVVPALVRRAAESLLPDSAAVVRVHPDVASAVRERVGSMPGVLDVRGDAALGRHDCRFDTPTGQLVADLSTQLSRLGASLQEADR